MILPPSPHVPRRNPRSELRASGSAPAAACAKATRGRRVMRRLEGKVAVITAATSGMALATAKLFVEDGAYVFITGRRKEKLDEAVKLIGRNVTGGQGDAANLAGLGPLQETLQPHTGQNNN